jgi:sodium bile acid symporter family protein
VTFGLCNGANAFGGALLRILGGFAAAYIAVKLVGADGINRQVLLLYGSLPAAAMNFILTEKFGQDPNLAASIVVLSTFFSVVTIPLVFWLILSEIPYLVLTTNSAYYKRICSCRYACSSESVETGNPVRIWDCPAAVSRNESRHKHWLSHELGSDGE